MTPPVADHDSLRAEARLFARYLLGSAISDEIAARYAEAAARLFSDAGDGPLAFVRRRPWAIGPLDAAAGWLRPRCALRQRLELMAAILETRPENADLFLPRTLSAPGLLALLVSCGGAAAFKAAIGFLIWPIAARDDRAKSPATNGGGA